MHPVVQQLLERIILYESKVHLFITTYKDHPNITAPLAPTLH